MPQPSTRNQALTTTQRGGKKSSLTPLAVSAEIEAALPWIEDASSDRGDGNIRFEFWLSPGAKPLENLLWKDAEPSATYYKHGYVVRYRFTVPASKWRRVYAAWTKAKYVGKGSYATADLAAASAMGTAGKNAGKTRVVGEAA